MSMNNEKKAKGKLSALLGQRKFRYGTYATILTIVVIIVVILLNVALGAIETNWALTVDVTAINATDFDDATYEILKRVEDEIHVYTVYQTSTSSAARIQVDSVLEKYHALNNRIVLGNIDPVKEPTRVTKYAGNTNLSEGSVIVTNADETRVKLINRSEYSYTQSFSSTTYSIFDLESKMSSALVYVTSTDTPMVYFLTGHGEMDRESYFTILTRQLQLRNYDVTSLNLLNDGVTLKNGDTVVITNPSHDLDDSEYETLLTWLNEGGRLLVTLDFSVDTTVLPNLTRLLDYYQLSFGDGLITENESSTDNYVSYGTLYLRPNVDADHKITSSLAETRQLMIPQVRPINDVAIPESGVVYTKLLTSSNKATVVNGEDQSAPGTQTIAMSAARDNYDDETKNVRIVLLGSSYLLADTQLLYSTDNLYFTINAFDWLVNSNSTVSISSKYVANSVLSIPDATTAWVLAAVVVVAIPLIVLIIGIVVWVKRRRL